MNPSPRPLSDSTPLNIGAVRLIVGGIIILVPTIWWAASVTSQLGAAVKATETSVIVQSKQSEDIAIIKDSINSLAVTVKDVQKDAQEASKDQWTLAASYWWQAEFQRLNPTSGLRLPDLGSLPAAMRGGKDER